jgi:hypothetical protein
MSYGHERIRIDVTLADQKLAQECVAWVLGWEADGRKLSDYEWNVLTAVKAGLVNYRTANLVASILPSYRRHMGQLQERAALPPSNHVGTVGERLILTLTITRIFTHEGEFGCTFIHGFRDEAGNDLVWFGSSQLTEADGKRHEVGDTVTVKGTVKGHNEYKGRKQTQLSRVALYTPPAPKVRKPRAKKVQAPVVAEVTIG